MFEPPAHHLRKPCTPVKPRMPATQPEAIPITLRIRSIRCKLAPQSIGSTTSLVLVRFVLSVLEGPPGGPPAPKPAIGSAIIFEKGLSWFSDVSKLWRWSWGGIKLGSCPCYTNVCAVCCGGGRVRNVSTGPLTLRNSGRLDDVTAFRFIFFLAASPQPLVLVADRLLPPYFRAIIRPMVSFISILPWVVCFVARKQPFVPIGGWYHRSRSLFSSETREEEEPSSSDLLEKAKQLRRDVESFEASKKASEDQQRQQVAAVKAEQVALRERYSAVVPILKPDGSEQEERCDFSPKWKEGSSRITVVESALPIGVILGESEQFPLTTVVDEVGEGSNGGAAGLQVGDLVRAFTACKVEMEMPTWQILAGGIGMPKTKRFMYSADGRPFEEVMEAIASNRQDPEQRPVLMVIERNA